jgi:hypothetical protein
MRLGGFVQQVQQRMCQHGTATRQRERSPGPIGPDTLAKKVVELHVWDLEALFHGALRALVEAGVFEAKVTGMADETDLATTARNAGCAHATWNVLRLIAAVTTVPPAVTGVQMQTHETPGTWALVTQARAHRADAARRHSVAFARGSVGATDLWWLDQQGRWRTPSSASMSCLIERVKRSNFRTRTVITLRLRTAVHGRARVDRSDVAPLT